MPRRKPFVRRSVRKRTNCLSAPWVSVVTVLAKGRKKRNRSCVVKNSWRKGRGRDDGMEWCICMGIPSSLQTQGWQKSWDHLREIANRGSRHRAWCLPGGTVETVCGWGSGGPGMSDLAFPTLGGLGGTGSVGNARSVVVSMEAEYSWKCVVLLALKWKRIPFPPRKRWRHATVLSPMLGSFCRCRDCYVAGGGT